MMHFLTTCFDFKIDLDSKKNNKFYAKENGIFTN